MVEKRKVRDGSEFKMWLYALLFMVVLSIIVFATQRFMVQTFNIAFEINVFYIPTIILLIIVIYQKMEREGGGDFI